MERVPGAGLIALSLLAVLCVPLQHAAGQEVSFADSNLETAVREAIGKPTGTIYASDLQGLRELEATDRGITDLAGIQHCTDLQQLWLGGNQIVSLQPMSSLFALQHLYLWDNRIADLNPLSGLGDLTVLDLAGNLIDNLAPLSPLTALVELGLEHNLITDLQPLGALTNLEMLGLSFNSISDVQPLANLSNLHYLSLWSNQLASLQALDGLSDLRVLDASANGIADLQPLAGLSAVQYLYLADNAIADLSPLAGLHSLEHLDLAYNLVSDIAPLVANPGVGASDVVILNQNWLVLGLGTQAFLDVQSLRDRGVNVWCDNQRAPQPPLPPANIAAVINPNGHVDLTWTDCSDDEEGFNIQRRRQNSDGSWPEQWTTVAALPANRQAHTDATLAATGTYQYRIGAYNAVGASYWAVSEGLAVTPPAPQAPSNLKVRATAGSTAMYVTWQDNSDNETSFKVERRRWLPTEHWSDWETRLWTSPNFTSFVDYDIPVGSSYQYRVRAVNHVGHSEWATSIGVRCEPTPLWPVDLTAHQTDAAEGIQLTWRDKSSIELGFELQRRKRNADGSWPEWTTVGWPAANVESWSDLNISERGTHEYRVRAHNDNGSSEWSQSASVWALPRIPRSPSNLKVQATAASTAMYVTWQDNSDNETSFKVERRRWLPTQRWSDWQTRLWTSPNFTSFVDYEMPVGSSYQYRVRAVNHVGHSEWATSIGVRCEPTPLWPVDLQAQPHNSSEDVLLTWRSKSDKETHLKVQRRRQLGEPDVWSDWLTIVWLGGGVTQHLDNDIPGDGQYEYRVCVFNENGPSEFSLPATIWRTTVNPSVLSVTSMSAVQTGQTASVVYSLSASADVMMVIRNIAGRLVATVHHGRVSKGIQTANWNLRNGRGAPVPSGVYICTLIAREDDGGEARMTGGIRVQR